MILEFSLWGFCSFCQKETLYLIPVKGARIKGTRYENNFMLNLFHKPMKSAIIFGANASGKTNLILGLEKLMLLLKNGLDIDGDFIKNKLVNHHSECIGFEIELLDQVTSNVYYYSIQYNQKEVISECLKCDNEVIFNFDERKFTIKSVMLKNQLEEVFSNQSTETHIKKLNDYGIEEIKQFKELFNKMAIVRDTLFNFEAKEVVSQIEEKGKLFFESKMEQVISLLTMLDKTIETLEFQKIIQRESSYILHLKRIGSSALYPLSQESDGIKKIMNLMQYLLKISEGGTVVIDELDSSISTYSLMKLFNLFINATENTCGQLIVTSHNALLFNNDIFSPQQIFLVDKNEQLCSEIHALSEYQLRSEKENIFMDYLKGRFGGING